MQNPLLDPWSTPFEIPPFDKIEPVHFKPAVEKAISMAKAEIDKITNSSGEPEFSNTIEALENTGKLLNKISATLFNLNSAETSPDIQAATQEISPLLTKFSNDITLNEELFQRVDKVYKTRQSLSLTREQEILLKDKWKEFINGGASLSGEAKSRFRKISEDLSKLSLQFEENLLAETNDYELHITDRYDLAGLPDTIIEQSAAEALKKNQKGWIFTLHAPSYMPFMQYSDNRELREKLLKAYSSRCFKGNKSDNREIVKRIVNLRLEKAKLLGYDSYAGYVLEDRMASSPSEVNKFLKEMFKATRPFALKNYREVKDFAHTLGHRGDLERWDWAYYSEKLKRERLTIDDEILRPYFRLDNVEKAIFSLAGDLYGLSFTEREDIPHYHHEVRSFEVKDKNGVHIAILFTDYHPRKGKSGGAWMTNYRDQYMSGTNDIRPVVSIVMNFTGATETKPALLTHNELTTFLHEFGHALHGMLSKCTYESLSGANVKRDFVELPSQIMENWAYEKEWLDKWARHYQTGEKIPAETIDKIKASLTFNEGYACNRQVSFGMLDMAWHSLTSPFGSDVQEFESDAMASTELFNPVAETNMSCAFGHLFSGGYAAGYYGYKWAEVLDADAFSLFIERGLSDSDTAGSFKENILEKGGTEEPDTLYKKFRGKEPDIDALLKRSGFLIG
ncbi:MAG: M3 family metallopeptidase [Bacteroidales bacterium]|nr:M3 family metallopeptidase [Bacteroidales bacterium]